MTLFRCMTNLRTLRFCGATEQLAYEVVEEILSNGCLRELICFHKEPTLLLTFWELDLETLPQSLEVLVAHAPYMQLVGEPDSLNLRALSCTDQNRLRFANINTLERLVIKSVSVNQNMISSVCSQVQQLSKLTVRVSCISPHSEISVHLTHFRISHCLTLQVSQFDSLSDFLVFLHCRTCEHSLSQASRQALKSYCNSLRSPSSES